MRWILHLIFLYFLLLHHLDSLSIGLLAWIDYWSLNPDSGFRIPTVKFLFDFSHLSLYFFLLNSHGFSSTLTLARHEMNSSSHFFLLLLLYLSIPLYTLYTPSLPLYWLPIDNWGPWLPLDYWLTTGAHLYSELSVELMGLAGGLLAPFFSLTTPSSLYSLTSLLYSFLPS